MKLFSHRKSFVALAVLFLAARLLAADTNEPAVTAATGVTREEVASQYLHLQEMIHESEITAVKSQQLASDAALATAKSNADVLSAKLQSLEDTVARQHVADADAAHRTQQSVLYLAGAFGLAGLGIMLLMVYFMWRAFTQIAQISAQQNLSLTNGNAVHQLAAPGRATVETTNAQLLGVVDRLERRIQELESGQKMLPEIVGARPGDLLTEGQKHLEANAPHKALECIDKYIASHPERAEALVKRAAALEKLDREEEALASYNRAIALDGTLVIAHLHKGGLLNRMRRYDEALNCYEQALHAQEKKPAAK
jgi:hypothetical protein